MAVARGLTSLVLARPVFHSSKNKVPRRLPSVLYGMAEKVIEVQYVYTDFFHAFTSSGLTRLKLDIQVS